MGTRAELSLLVPAVQITTLAGPHYIPSNDSSCTHVGQDCECVLEFDCPLCQIDPTDTLQAMETHYWNTHWNQRVEVGKYTLFPCGLLHAASSRISCMMYNVRTLHYHCPFCLSSTFTGLETLRTHCAVLHSTARQHETGDELTPDEQISVGSASQEQGRVSFSDTVTLRRFPLARSIAEQAGGRSEAKRVPASFGSFVALRDISDLTSAIFSLLGCSGPSRLKLFKGMCFLLCGTDVAPSTLAAIYSLGGTVSGAGYAESDEWSKITHVLLGNRIGPRSVRTLRKNIPMHVCESIWWVSGDWIRNSVEKGTIFRDDGRFFMPAAIERFFAVKEANARADRQKARMIVRSPNISSVNISVEPRMSPPIITSEDTSRSSMCTPSPVCSNVFNAPVIRPIITPILRPVTFLNAMPITKPPLPNESFALRRSKRLSMAPSPAKLGIHPPIHKP